MKIDRTLISFTEIASYIGKNVTFLAKVKSINSSMDEVVLTMTDGNDVVARFQEPITKDITNEMLKGLAQVTASGDLNIISFSPLGDSRFDQKLFLEAVSEIHKFPEIVAIRS